MAFTINALTDAIADVFDVKEGFRRGFVFELRDVRDVFPLQVHVLVLNPEKYVISEPFQSVLTPTEDDHVVREENGLIIREISIEGTMGLTGKRATGFAGVQFGGAKESGNKHFHDLRQMFRKYSRLKKSGLNSAHVRMIFHSLKDDDHFIVVPRFFETPRDARSTRAHYRYRISLAVVGLAENNLIPADVDDPFDFFTDELASVSAAFNDARSFFAEVTADLSIIKRKVANINAVMLQAAGIINAVGNMLRGGGELIAYPLSLAEQVLASVERAADTMATSVLDATQGTDARIQGSLRRLGQSLDRIKMFPHRFGPSALEKSKAAYRRELALTEDDIAENLGGATIGSRTRITAGSGRDAGIDFSGYRGFTKVLVGRTTTIEGLSATYGVPPELIILANDLRFPYFAPGGGPGILAPGDYILVPIREGVSEATLVPGDENLSLDEALYGSDLALDPDLLAAGEFEVMEDDVRSGLDALLVRGVPNVVQGVAISVLTQRGTTVYLPDIGILRNVGIKGTVQHVLLAALTLREAILADPRIEAIESSRVVLEDDVLTQEVVPVLRGRREGTALILPFGRVTGAGSG